MAKKKAQASAVTRFTADEISKMSPEQLAEALNDLNAKNEEMQAQLSKKPSTSKPSSDLPTFEVDEDEDSGSDIVPGKYRFTAPTFIWDDNSVIDVRALAASSSKKDKEFLEEIEAKLLQRGSGIVELIEPLRKEDE